MAKPSLSRELDQLVEALLARRDSQPVASDPRLAALLELARDLLDLPRQEFKARLKTDLERRATMSGATGASRGAAKVRPVPEGHHSVAPYLCIKGAAQAIDFYQRVFNAKQLSRLNMPDGRIGHAEIQIGDSRIMLSDEFPDYGNLSPQTLGGTPVNLHLYVADPDAFAARAAAAGAHLSDPVEDRDYGERLGGFTDPFGHVWTVSRPLRPGKLAPGEVREGFHTVTPHLTVADGAKAIEFYKQAFGATPGETITDPDGRLAHGEIRVGDSHIML
ncbi:MAG TPA: VOC family protein, partial [Terriglobia bacterium]|nr:VOC family protein [Terriglobia bacterium]